jgi:ABC-type branched-subunit amino acid transport system ATPase component
MSDAAPILAVDGIHAGYQSGIDILQDLSLSAEARRLTLIIGPNGAGKSTLLRTIFGFLHPHGGSVTFNGERIDALQPYAVKRRGVSYVPQEINIFPHLTVEENLRMGAWTLRQDKARLRRHFERTYETFPALAARRRLRAGDLSGGQGRLLSVAREMMTEPTLMLVDEPTAGLAPNLVDEVYDLLDKARQAIGATVVLVDQNVEDALPHADYIYMINLGRIKAEGPPRDFTAPRIRELIQECLLG